MTPALDPKKVAETNPAVDVKKLDEVQRIRGVLEAAGVQIKADYRVAPALRPAKKQVAGKVFRLSQ